MRRVIVAVASLVITGACAQLEASAPTTTTTIEAPNYTTLEIRIAKAQTPAQFDRDRPDFIATLSCADRDSGTGFLTDRERIRNACIAVRTVPAVSGRLINGPRSAVACTEIFGGREVAEIVGEVFGTRVSTLVHRTDGCGMADWDLLGALLVPPYDEL